MAVTITHLEGPLAGQVQEFDDSVDLITFGRSPECLVAYPPDCIEVGRLHLALGRGPIGDYFAEIFANRYVAIEGVVAHNGMRAKSGSLITLGRPDGPCFKFEFMAEMSDVMADFAFDSPEPTEDEASLPRNPFEPSESAVDLLFKRKELVPAAIAGLEETVASSIPRRPAPLPAATRPRGVGAASEPHPYFGDDMYLKETSLGNVSQRAESPADYAPPVPMERRRSNRSFWWAALALALGAGVIGCLLFGRGAALGAALGKLLPAMVPPPPAKETGADLVDVSVFGPTSIQAGGEGLVQVFLHTLSQREIAKTLAQEADPDTARRGVQTLATKIAEGQHVQIMLDARGLGADQEMQTLVWRGEPCVCQFTVSAPEDATGRTFHPHVLVLVDSVPVGSLTFALKVSKEVTASTEMRGDRARRYGYAFLSYASPDRAEVIKRAQGLKAGGTNFFNDLLSLEPGERWEQRLYSEIDRCDVFYLFWSSKAKASDWVMKEIEYALARRLVSENGDPDIIPIIIEGPPPPAPPESLKDIHFNDSLTCVLAGIEGWPASAR